jgi:predicted lactoylglutathione lyase
MKNTNVRNLDKLKELEISAREYTTMGFEFNKQ